MAIGDNIQAFRKRVGLTQKELALLCNCAVGTIQQYELGKRQPRIEQLEKIADALHTTTAELLGNPKKDKPIYDSYLKDKLEQIGCSIGHNFNSYWINLPDSILDDVTLEELQELDQSTASYLSFKLKELIDKHKDTYFRFPENQDQ